MNVKYCYICIHILIHNKKFISTISTMIDNYQLQNHHLKLKLEQEQKANDIKIQDIDINQVNNQQEQRPNMAVILHAFNNRLTIEEERAIKRNQDQEKVMNKLISKKRTREELMPTHREVQESIEELKSVLPRKDINKIINLLYTNLVCKNQNGEEKSQLPVQKEKLFTTQRLKRLTYNNQHKNLYQNSSIQQLQNNIKSLGSIDKQLGRSVTYNKDQNYKKKFTRPILQQKYIKKRFVAYVIWKRDYGVVALDEEIAQSKMEIKIDRMEYKSTAFSVATQTYRKIQIFLVKQCGKKIKPINREELRSIFSVILNCRLFFQEAQTKTMLKFICAMYGLDNVTISQLQALNLYKSIQQKLKTRITQKTVKPLHPKGNLKTSKHKYKFKDMEKSNVFKLDKIWNIDYERQFLELYKIDPHFSLIKDYFKEKYPQNQDIFTMDALRSRFCKIIRAALRKIFNLNEKFQKNLPKMVKMSDIRIKFLQRSPDGRQLRYQIIDLYLQEEPKNIQKIKEVILQINQYIQIKQRERANPNYKKYKIEQQQKPKRKSRAKAHKTYQLNNQSNNLQQANINTQKGLFQEYNDEFEWQKDNQNEDYSNYDSYVDNESNSYYNAYEPLAEQQQSDHDEEYNNSLNSFYQTQSKFIKSFREYSSMINHEEQSQNEMRKYYEGYFR